MVPLSEIVARIRTRHEANSTARWSDADIARIVNEGLDDLSESTSFYERHVVVPLEQRRYYDLRGFLPESALGVTSIWSTIDQRWLVPSVPDNLDYRWEEATGAPQRYWVRGLFWLGLWPLPNSDSGFLRIYFAGYAPHFNHSQDVLADLPDDFIPALEEYALYEMSAQDGDTDKALGYYASYTNRVKGLADFVDKRTETARTGVIGGRR